MPGVNEALAAYQPQAVFFGGSMAYNNLRWVGTESGTPSYPVWSNDNPGGYGTGRPDGSVFMPAESDTTISASDQWFWKPNYDFRTLADLQAVYHATVGANSNMLLNIAPNADGIVPPEAMALYAAFGAWHVACYGSPGASYEPQPGAVIELDVSALASVDRVVAMEDQSGGEQVLAYSVEVQAAGGAWLPAETGQAIGHKRIHRLAAPVAGAQRVRLNVTATIGGVDPSSVKWASFAAIDGAASKCNGGGNDDAAETASASAAAPAPVLEQAPASAQAQAEAQALAAAALPLPNAPQLAWQRGEIMALIHFNMATFFENGDPGCTAANWLPADGSGSGNPKSFAPTALNVSQWVDSMVAIGVDEAVLTAKHGCGFYLWPTQVKLPDGSPYTYHVDTDAYGDVLAQFRDATSARGIGHGFYYSLTNNRYLNVYSHQVQPGPLQPGQVNVTQQQFEDIAFASVSELWTNYGALTEICESAAVLGGGAQPACAHSLPSLFPPPRL